MTAYGFTGPVTLAHKKGLKTDKLPAQKRADGDVQPNTNPTPKYVPKKAVPKPDDAAFNAFVDFAHNFTPAVNVAAKNCGIGRKSAKAADGRKMMIFKNDCPDIKSDWNIKMRKEDWAVAKKSLYETRDADGHII